MKKINFENLPSTNTPISAGNLNQMQSNIEESAVIVSPTEPTTSEKVWVQKGKNLFNKNNVTRDVMLEDDGSLTSYYNYYVSDYIPIQSGKTYTLGTTASTRNKFFKSNYTPYSTGRDVDAQYNANTFTVPDDVCFIRITIDLNECDINQVQLEQGTTATPYEAYVEPKIYVKNDNGVYEEFIKVEKDTGWIPFSVGSNFTNFSWMPLAYRKIGKNVYIHGGGTLDTSVSKDIAQLPSDCIPRGNIQQCCLYNSGTTIQNISITSSGLITLLATASTTGKIELTINMSFVTD